MKERDNNLEITTEKKRRNVAIVVVVCLCFAILGCIMAITSGMDAIEASVAEVTTEFHLYKESMGKKIVDIERALSAYEDNSVEDTESYTTEELVDLCMKGDYNSFLKVCKYQDTPTNVLSLTARKIVSKQYTNAFGEKWEEKDTKMTKLVMLILEHPNCTRSVLIQLLGIDRENLIPILIMSNLNDSGTLMLFAENCKRDSFPKLDWIVLIANHEAVTEGVIRELMTITDEEEINSMLQERLNDLQGK